MQELVALNLIYFLFAFFLIYPPNEVISLGFSIPALFSSILGSEQMVFIHHHMMRISITILIHSGLPIGYYLFLGFFSDLDLFNFTTDLSIYWRIYFMVSLSILILFATLVYYWQTNDFANHPVASKLRLFSPNLQSWKEIANEINIEFRRVDKFSAGSMFNRVYVTDNWLIKVGLYTINVCKHQDMELVLTHANEVSLTQDGSPSVQYLNILVKPMDHINNTKIKPFYIHLNSFEYKDFNDKLQRPVREACDIIIKQSLPEQFLDAFREQINTNEVYETKREEVETCIGCMRKLADIKLLKSCDSDDCKQCFCRPMWCLECMGKWFAYRQDQSQPNTWLSSKATCATCRATFCMLDVAAINFID